MYGEGKNRRRTPSPKYHPNCEPLWREHGENKVMQLDIYLKSVP